MTAEAFLTHHVRVLSKHYEVHLVANAAPEAITHPDLLRAVRHRVRIEREISPLADALAVLRLARLLRAGGYVAVHSLTPKAGLLTAVAGWIAHVPARIHTYTGQVWATRTGVGRALLKNLDRVIARLDTHLLADSLSQLEFLRAERVLRNGQGAVLARGSVCGVDGERFRPDDHARVEIRHALDIPGDAVVFLFLGRLTRDKGVLDLASAFSQLAAERADVFLVLAGPDEAALEQRLREACGAGAERVRFAGYAAQPERYMAAADVFCLPSYREGFGSVVLEAAAAGVPAIGSRIYGVTDAIEDGVTGLMHPPRDVAALTAAMRRLAADPMLRSALGHAARSRALEHFSQDQLAAELLDFYRKKAAPALT